jgi:hypothetical protein
LINRLVKVVNHPYIESLGSSGLNPIGTTSSVIAVITVADAITIA